MEKNKGKGKKNKGKGERVMIGREKAILGEPFQMR